MSIQDYFKYSIKSSVVDFTLVCVGFTLWIMHWPVIF